MPVRGDFKRLDQLLTSLDRLADGAAVEKLTARLGEEALKLVDEGFQQGRDPAGKAWPRPAYRSGRPMIHTGRLRRSYRLRVTGTRFEIISPLFYAYPLQHFARRTVPDPAKITSRWDRALRAAADRWVRSEFS